MKSLTASGKRRKGKGGRRLLGALALAAGAVGTALLVRRSNKGASGERRPALDHPVDASGDRWARPGMEVAFRAELKPGRGRSERTFRVKSLLPSGRVTLEGVAGEHAEQEFEPLR